MGGMLFLVSVDGEIPLEILADDMDEAVELAVSSLDTTLTAAKVWVEIPPTRGRFNFTVWNKGSK